MKIIKIVTILVIISTVLDVIIIDLIIINLLLQIEDSCSIADSIANLVYLNNLDKFMYIDINLTNLTLKVILLITKDKLRTNDLSLIKLVIIRS